ncbi:MAG: hypothetical protein CM15mP64_7100 [Candidatus Neomarinimicrobiota bacterium]|nr:MAG: hypothetical protein CM15mP64_7100 [Candidatus Neomarinimicrobiota bacterium]
MSKIDQKDRFYYNSEFLGSSSGRSIRILSEYYGPLQRLERNNISDTIVFLDPLNSIQRGCEKGLRKCTSNKIQKPWLV